MSVAPRGSSSGLMRALLWPLLGAVLLAAMAAWWLQTFERVPKEVVQPPRGEAAYNPLYQLARSLEARGVPVDARAGLALASHPPGRHDVLLLGGDTRGLAATERRQVVDWVAGGGRLLMALPERGWWRSAGAVPDAGLAADFGIAAVPIIGQSNIACARVRAREAGSESSDLFCFTDRIDVGNARLLAGWRDGNGQLLHARIAWGEGTVDVFPSLRFLHNMELSKPVHAGLAWRALQPLPTPGQGTVHLVHDGSMPSLARMLLQHAWMAWLPLLLALLGWLHARTQRRGPLRPSPELARRALLEHVRASGLHVLRFGRGHVLHAELRRAFDERLRRRDPLAASLHGLPARQALAQRSGLPADAIDQALHAPPPDDPRALRLHIARLNQLRRRL